MGISVSDSIQTLCLYWTDSPLVYVKNCVKEKVKGAEGPGTKVPYGTTEGHRDVLLERFERQRVQTFEGVLSEQKKEQTSSEKPRCPFQRKRRNFILLLKKDFEPVYNVHVWGEMLQGVVNFFANRAVQRECTVTNVGNQISVK